MTESIIDTHLGSPLRFTIEALLENGILVMANGENQRHAEQLLADLASLNGSTIHKVQWQGEV